MNKAKKIRTTKQIVSVVLSVVLLLSGLYGLVVLRYPKKYLDEINAAAARFGVDKELIQAIIWTESKYKADAVSNAGAEGLMQLLPSTASWCAEMLEEKAPTKEELFDPETNIHLGAYYLSYLLKRFEKDDAIAAYNAGQGNVRKWLDEGLAKYPYKETTDYVKRVSFAQKIYKARN